MMKRLLEDEFFSILKVTFNFLQLFEVTQFTIVVPSNTRNSIVKHIHELKWVNFLVAKMSSQEEQQTVQAEEKTSM